MSSNLTSIDYIGFFDKLKKRVSETRYKAALYVNQELILLYHHIGTEILRSQEIYGWGAKVIDQLSLDLKKAFPESKGFSPRSLKYMRKFAQEYPDTQFVQQSAAQLPWGHIMYLLDSVSDKQIRNFYIEQTAINGWPRTTLATQIETALHTRKGAAISNFKTKLPAPQSELAHRILKDPYIFDFLNVGDEAQEREVERALITHMEKFLLELGAGFAFVGRQYHLEVGGQDFYIDLLFYHLKLRCFCVIELKDKDFKPEYAGKMNFYLSAVDDLVKHPTDQPSIGIILCKSKNNVLAEYTLRDMGKPIGLSEYRLTEAIPKEIKTSLPTIEQLEAELSKDFSKTYDEETVNTN